LTLITTPRIYAAIGFSLCLLLAGCALSRFVAAMYLLYPEFVVSQHPPQNNASNVAANDLLTSIADTKNALSWYPSAKAWLTLAILEARLTNSSADMAFAQQQLYLTDQAIQHSLTLAPLEPYAWYRRTLLGLPIQTTLKNLQMSCYAGRVEPELLVKRLRLYSFYLTNLDQEAFDSLFEQIRLAEIFYPQDLANLAHNQVNLLPIIQTALQYDQDQWTQFLNRVEKPR
jgi:hypothetical protein